MTTDSYIRAQYLKLIGAGFFISRDSGNIEHANFKVFYSAELREYWTAMYHIESD